MGERFFILSKLIRYRLHMIASCVAMLIMALIFEHSKNENKKQLTTLPKSVAAHIIQKLDRIGRILRLCAHQYLIMM